MSSERIANGIVVLVSANAEWRPTVDALRPGHMDATPYGDVFTYDVRGERLRVVHGGWGKISAAASAEYVVSTWQPELLINLGTCGGIAGRTSRGETLVVTRTIAYDIEEAMGDSVAAVMSYTTDIDVGWLDGLLPGARRTHLVSGDRDLRPSDVADLVRRYDAVAADWESAAIAYVARRRATPLAIIRTVSDLVDTERGETIGDLARFENAADSIMPALLAQLPAIVAAFRAGVRPTAPRPA